MALFACEACGKPAQVLIPPKGSAYCKKCDPRRSGGKAGLSAEREAERARWKASEQRLHRLSKRARRIAKRDSDWAAKHNKTREAVWYEHARWRVAAKAEGWTSQAAIRSEKQCGALEVQLTEAINAHDAEPPRQ
jgi:hypothetical protein